MSRIGATSSQWNCCLLAHNIGTISRGPENPLANAFGVDMDERGNYKAGLQSSKLSHAQPTRFHELFGGSMSKMGAFRDDPLEWEAKEHPFVGDQLILRPKQRWTLAGWTLFLWWVCGTMNPTDQLHVKLFH